MLVYSAAGNMISIELGLVKVFYNLTNTFINFVEVHGFLKKASNALYKH